jgi:tellurium resistance protein TerD
MEKVNLSKGNRVDLQKAVPSLKRIRVGLGWDANKFDSGSDYDLDVTAFILTHDANGDAKCASPSYMIFYNNLSSPGKEVTHTGDNRTGSGEGDDESLVVDVQGTLAIADEVSFIITIDNAVAKKQNFGQISKAYAKIYNDEDGSIIAQYDLAEEFSGETAIQIGSLYKNAAGNMAFRAVGQGFNAGLGDFVDGYGLNR